MDELEELSVLFIIEDETNKYTSFVCKNKEEAWKGLLNAVFGCRKNYSLDELDNYEVYSFARHQNVSYLILDAFDLT